MQKKIRNKISLLKNVELPFNITSAEGLITEELLEKLVNKINVPASDLWLGIHKEQGPFSVLQNSIGRNEKHP